MTSALGPVAYGEVAARWHCAGCNRLRPKAGVWLHPCDEGASHHIACPNCAEHEVFGTGWQPLPSRQGEGPK